MHEKKKKGGYSFYLNNWNPSAKKYIRNCVLCGRTGYNPAIDEEGFVCSRPNYVIRRELTRILPPLELDSRGRCSDCARLQDSGDEEVR